MFVIHFSLIIVLVLQNKKARSSSYSMPLHPKTRSLFTKTMRFSGLIIFLYIGLHLYDFTFTPHTMDNSVVRGEYLGLYGHVYTLNRSINLVYHCNVFNWLSFGSWSLFCCPNIWV